MTISADQRAAIAQLRAQESATKRPTVPALEDILYTPFEVLDHGFVRVIDYMGDDAAVVQAARVSYGTGTKQVSEDAGLIKYLMRHRHSTPFEMCEIKFHVKLPIFVARQWIRHRTANVNEVSARYSILDKEFYIPDVAHCAPQSKQNHQGRDETQPLTREQAEAVQFLLRHDATQCYQHYAFLTKEKVDGHAPELAHDAQYEFNGGWDERPEVRPLTRAGRSRTFGSDDHRPEFPGLARELARMNLTLNTYTQWYWKVDLHNLLHFLSLRADGHAQYEIRVYAEAMLDVVKRWVPAVYEAFTEYRLGGVHFSATGLTVVRRMLAGETVTQETSGLGKREWAELQATLAAE